MTTRTPRNGSAAIHARNLEEILAQFRTARLRLLDRLGELQPELFVGFKLHSRLMQPMRLVDHLYVVADHDDHHLAKIWGMIRSRMKIGVQFEKPANAAPGLVGIG
jgi:hypothetical protein